MGRLHIYLSDELLARMDGLRGHESRSSFIRRAVEATVLGNRALPSVPMDEPEPPRRRPPEPKSKPVEGTPLPKIAPRHWG